MQRRSAGSLAWVAVTAALSLPQVAHAADVPGFNRPVQEHRLGNGLRVVLAPDETLPDVSIIVRYEAGRGDDPDGMEGLAHVTEHVLFSAFRHGAHAKLLLDAGASYVNAHTTLDFTSFEETVPPEALDLALWLEGARMTTALDVIDGSLVARERAIVGQEYVQHTSVPRGFDVFGRYFDVAWDELYPAWHPYHSTQDPVASAGGLAADDVRAFAATWYSPNNASVIVAGHFEPERAFRLVQRYFGSIPVRAVPHRPALPPLTPPGDLWLDIGARVTHPFAILAWRAPPDDTPQWRALVVAANLLASSPGTPARTFADEEHGALRITVRIVPAAAGGVLAVGVETKAGVTVADLLLPLQRALAAFSERLTEDDVAQARARISAASLGSLETSMGRSTLLSDPRFHASWWPQDYRGIVRADVVQAMASFLAPAQRVTVVVRPSPQSTYGGFGVLLHRDRMAR